MSSNDRSIFLRPRRIPVLAPKALQFNDLRGYDALGFGDMSVGFGKPA